MLAFRHHEGGGPKCNGMTSVNISMKMKANGGGGLNTAGHSVVGIVHYKDLEDALAKNYVENLNGTIKEYQRVSTLATVLFQDPNDLLDLRIKIKFWNDLSMPGNSSLSGIYCARVELPSNTDNITTYSMWMSRQPQCDRKVSREAITCICNQPGTYALVRLTKNDTEVSLLFLNS